MSQPDAALSPAALSTDEPIRLALIGCGGMARHHLKRMLATFDQTIVPVVSEPSPQAYEETAALFEEFGRVPPTNEPDLDRLLARHGSGLDAVFIITPHVLHYEQATACLEAGLDVLLEKPMVMTASEAERLIATRDRSGRLLVVAFQGSLSPEVRRAAEMLRSGEVGELLSISATVWQDWAALSAGTWRQRPHVAGGGFLFDTGAHMLNTVADLVGEPFTEVSAWFANRGQAVETIGVVMARSQSGTLVTLHGCGETVPSCTSDVLAFATEGILRTGVWGRRLEIQRRGDDDFVPVPLPPSSGVWEQFLAVRRGEIPNPSPPEVGLRMAHLWDAIRESAARDGATVTIGGTS